MTYEHIVTGTFISRPNRFIAHVETGGRRVVCHVKNTGRCRELLLAGATVILEFHPGAALAGRKTEYDLIGVYKGELLINMDSQAPNKAAWEWLTALGEDRPPETSCLPPGSYVPFDIRREVTHGDSRFDLAFSLRHRETDAVSPAFMEVKGVTLEEHGLAMFPDAPTERGIKHLKGLIRAREEGYEAYVLFVIQMKGVQGFTPNDITHPAFGEALRQAHKAGVHVLAYDCLITPDTMAVDLPVRVMLD
jgi:sugar fermentation stimulation protein A